MNRLVVVFILTLTHKFAVGFDNKATSNVVEVSASAVSQLSNSDSTVRQSSESDLNEFVELTSKIKSLKAEFKQTISDQFGTKKDQTLGNFVIKKPAKFIWETVSPFEQLIVSNGKSLWTFDQDLDQVNIQDLNTAVGNTPVFLLEANKNELAKTFNVKKLLSGEETSATYELTPKEPGYAFERMMVLFKSGVLNEIFLIDTLGQQTVVQLTDVAQNITIEDSEFEFTPPDSVDVMDSRQPTTDETAQ
ncbi:MAG: outer membrane lipoprotein chaperone LolA [Gammaproteobacteria bacterium]|nr:outer membrane lipoprotein chaperone LolA [Gammaproteobacteria bacterium]